MSANNTFPENSPYAQYSYKNLNYVNPYSNFEEDEDSYISEFTKADRNAVEAIVNRNRALERKDYKEAQIYQKEYEYNSKLAQYYSDYEELNKKPNALNLFLEKQNISEDQKQRLIPAYHELIAQTFLKGLTQQYIEAEKKDALSNMPVPIGETLLQTNIVGGFPLNIPKFKIETTGEDRENLIYHYLEKYFYEDINEQFETNERLRNYYKPANEESVKKENERYNKEYADYVSGKRTTIPSKPKYQNDFFEDLLYSTVDKTTNIKPEDAYYNGLYNFYNEIYRNTIDVQAYGSEKAKQGYYDQSRPVTVVGAEPYISTNIEFVNHTVGREIYNRVESFADRKSEQLIMSRSIDRLKYNEFKKSHAKELKTLALNSDKKDLEKKFNITLHSENGISQNTYNRVYNDFIRGEAKNNSGSYNDEERDAYKIIDAYLTDKDLLTAGEIANFKTNVQDGGIWYGALKLEETNLSNRLALKFSNRLNSDSKQDRRTTITFDDGTNVILKENVDPRFSGIHDKEELDEFTKIYEDNKSIQEQQDIKSYMNTVVTKEVALQIEKSLYENPENAKTIDDYEKAKLNFIPKEAQEKVGTTGSSPNTPSGLLQLIKKGYANVKENKILEEIIGINTGEEGFIGATIYGKKFKKEQVLAIQQHEAVKLIKSNNEKTLEYFREIKNSSFWDNFGEGFLTKGMGSIETSLTSIYVRKDIQYYNNPELAFENGLAEKHRGSIVAGNYNNNFEQLVVKKEENGEDVIVANNIPEQIMGQEELIYLQTIKNKNEALDSWSNNAGLLTRVGESVGISAWFMAEMALTWGVYGAIGKGLIGTANTISRGMIAGAKGISSASESMMIGAGVRLGAKGVGVGTKAIGYVDAGVGYGLKGIGSIVEGGSYAAKYFGTALEIGKLSKIAQFPARLVQNTIANSVLSLVSPSTINFVMDDMNSKGKVHYVDVNGVTVPVGHPDVAAFLYDIEKQNYQEFKNTILDNDDKLLAYYGISGDVKNKKEILEKLRFDYNESFNKRQDELSFIKDKKGPQLYSSIAQGVYEQFLERFTETSIGTVLDLALKNTFGKLAGRAEMWLGKDTRVITDLSKKSAIIRFTRELTGIGAYEGGNFLQKTGFLGMKFINNYLFGRATVNGFVNSPLSEIGEEIFRQLLPTKVFNIPDGKTFLSSYAEDIAQLSSWKWWEEVSASVLLTTTMMKLGSSTIRSINDAGTNSELKDAKTIKEISNKRNELIKEFKDKPELKRKLNEFDAKNPIFITTPKTSGVKRRLMEDMTLDINYANEESLLGKWAAGNSFGVLMGQADIDYVSGWMAKSSKLNNVNISKEDAKAILMKKMVNNIAHVFSLRQENTVEALTLLKQRYETFFGKAKDGKSLMLDVINTQIDIEKKFNAKLTSLSKEIKTDDKIKLAFILRKISTQFHKTRHSMVELDLLKDTINSMFESNLPDEQKELISTISKLIGEINDNFFTNDFSLESNNEFKKDLATKLITLSRSIASLKNKTNDENQKVILEAGYQLLQKNMSNFTSFFASKNKISEIENDYYKSQLLRMIKKGINADVIEERLKGKLSKESQEFLNLYKTRSKNNSRQIKSSDLSNGDIIVKLLKDNQVKILIVNKELLPDGTIKTTLFDSLGNIEPNQDNLWTATEEETKIFVNEQQKLSKPSSVNTSTVYRPKHHFFKLTKDLMSSRKKALNYFYNWLQTEKDNLKNDTKSLEELSTYAEKIETALIEYFNLPNNRKKEVDLSDYGFDTTSKNAMIEIEPINIDSASNLDPEFILYLKKVYNIYNIKKIKDLKKLMKRKLGLFFDIKELESYKETVSEKSYNNYIENKINEFINEHLKNVYSFGFNLNEVRNQLKNEDTTEPIKIDEKGEYVFYDGKIHESKSFNKELYDFNNDIDPVSGMRKSQIVPQQNTNTKTTTEKTTEKNIETTTEKVEEKKEENSNDTQKDTSIKETSNESTAEESEQIKENTKEEIKNTSIIEEEKITSEYKIPELTKEEENLSDEERKNIVDENLKTIDFDELSDDDLHSFYSEEFSTLSELDEEFKNLKKAQINAIVKIAKAIKLQRITTWDNVVQFMINKGYLRDDSSISMIEIIRYSAFLADIHVSKSTIKEWFETVKKTDFKQYFDNKFNLNTHSISEDDVDDLLKFEKDIDVLYFQLTETQTPVDDSSFTVLWKNKDNRFYDKNKQEVNDENKSIVPYDYDNNITSNLFLRVPIRWDENGEQTDFLYVELPKQNLKNGLTNITKIFKKIKKATNLSEANKKSFLWAYMVEANPELRDNKKLQEHIKKFNFNDSDFQDINFKTHSLIYDIHKGFRIVEKFSLNLFDIRIPFEIVNFENENGEVLQTLSGIMDDDTMNNGGISINELKGLQAKKIEEKNKAEQLNRSELGLALVNVKKIIVKEVIHATLKKLNNRDISISTMLILIKDKIDEYVEKNYKKLDEKEKDLLKSQMLGLIPGTYDNSVSSEFAQLIGISKETTLNFIKKIEKAKIKLGNKEKKEQREFLLEKDPSELTIEEIEWLDNNLESDDLTKSEIEIALFGMADNQLSSEQKLSTIIGLALYGIEYKDVDNITRYLSVGEAIQLFVSAYSLGTEGYNWSFDHTHRNVQEKINNNDYSEDLKTTLNALFNRINDLSKDYEIGEAIIRELYTKMDVEGISFLALQRQLDEQSDFIKSKLIEIGTSNAMAKSDSAMFKGAVKSGLIELNLKEGFVIDGFVFNENKKNEANNYMRNIITINDPLYKKEYIKLFFNLIGLTRVPDSAIELLLKLNSDTKVNNYFKEGGIFYELINKDVVRRKSFNLIFTVNDNNEEQYNNISDIFKKTMLYEEQSFYDNGKLFYNLKNKSHTDDINNFLKYGDEHKRRKFLEEKHSFIGEVLLGDLTLADELYTQRLSSDLSRISGYEYFESFKDLTDDNKKIAMYNLFKQSSKFKKQINGFNLITFKALGITQSDYDVIDVNNTFGIDFISDIVFDNGEILITDRALDFIALHFFKEDVYRMKKFQENKIKNRRDMSQTGMLFLNIPELNSYRTDDGDTLNYLAVETITESDINSLYEKYKNVINNTVKDSIINDIFGILEYKNKELTIKNYDKTKNGFIDEFSDNNDIAKKIGNFIINQKLSYNNSLSLYFDDINDIGIKNDAILFAGGNINKRILDKEEYEYYNNEEISTLASNMLNTKDLKQQEELWDNLNEKINKITGMPHKTLQIEGTLNYKYEQNIKRYIQDALKNITNRARKLRSPSVRIFKGFTETFYGKKTYSILQLESFERPSEVLYKYMELHNIGTIYERQILKNSINDQNLKTHAEEIIKKYKNNKLVKVYSQMEEADGQEYESWRFRLSSLLAEGKVTNAQFEELREVFEKQMSELKSGKGIKTKLPDWLNDEYFAINKPVQVGNIDGRGLYVKSASACLTPYLIESSKELTQLAIKLDNFENTNHTIARVAFQSAIKQGQIREENSITKENILNPTFVFSNINAINDIDLYSYGLQVENPQIVDEESLNVLTSQGTKMFLSGVVAETRENVFEFLGRKYNGKELNEKYIQIMTELSNRKLEACLSDYGILRNIETNRYEIIKGNKYYKQLKKTLEEALKYDNREIGLIYKYEDEHGNIIESTREYDEEKYKLVSIEFDLEIWKQDQRGELQTILMADIRKYAAKHKIHGNKLKVMSSFGFENLEQKKLSIKDVKEENKVLLTNDYTGRLGAHVENGVIVHHVLAPMDIIVSTKNGIEKMDLSIYLNEDGVLILPEELKYKFSWRVPLSGIQSSSIIKVVGFLPKAVGNTLVTSQESAVQLGEDFDFDTRFTYNTVFNSEGKFIKNATEDKFVYDASYYTIDSSGLFGIGYDDLSNEEKIIALNNTIIDLFKSILLANNTEVQKAITNPINFEIMTETKKILEENKKEDRFTSVLDIDGQIAQMNDGSIGKLGVALASMYNTLQSMFGMADEKAPIKFKNPANGKYQNLNFGNISFDGSKGFSNRAIGGRLISELGSEKQNGFVDNRSVSQMLALGITEDTINQYLIMTLIYGIDKEIIDETTGKAVDYSSTFMQLPIIKEYNKRLKKEYNNKTFNPKTTYDEIEKELQEKYLSKTTIDSFDKNTREYFNNQEKFRLKNSKSLTAKKIIELSNREFESLEQEEKDILYSAFMNFKILSYQIGNMKKLNTIFGFEKNLIKKTNNSLENSTNEIIQILEGKHKINKSIENLDNLFGKIKTRDEIAGSEYNEYMELQRKYKDIPDDDIDQKQDIRNKLIEAKKRYLNRINKYIFIGKIDNEYKYLEPKNAIMARILSSRGYVELFENEFLSKQEWMNTLTKELDNYLNKQLMSAEKHGKYQESLRKFIIGIFNDNIITQLIDEDYRLDNGVVLTKQTFDNFINGDLYYLILEYCKNNQFNENKFIGSLYLDITKGKTNITIAYNNLNANKKELKDSVLELFNNNNNNQINSETEQLIKFKGTQYSQKDIMTLISLYAFKTNNINLISLLPSKFKESIQYNQRLSSIDYYLDNMDHSLVNTEDVFIVRRILNVDYIIDGAYYFNNKQKNLLDAALTKLNINHEFKNGQVILKDIKKENIKNYPLLFILQNAYLVSSMDEDKIPGLKRFFTEEKIKELHENNVLSFTRTQIISYFGWSNNDIHTRSKNLEYSRFNIFDKEKKENITIICHINESNSMVHFYPVNSPVKTAEEEERVIVIPETKNNNFIETNESNENEGTQHYEQIVKDKSLFNTETSTIYLTSSGLGTVMLADKFIQGEDVPSWFLESGGLRSLFTTSKKTVPVMAGIMFEDAIKEVQKTNDYSIENITEILKEKFSPKTFLGFDKNGKQLTVKTKTKKDKRFGIDRYILSDEKTKKSINKICSDENIKDMAMSIRAYLLSNSKYQSFESFQETLPEDSPLKEGLISMETEYGKLMLATIPDQIAINDNINELIDIKFLQKEFTTKEEAISHVFNTYLQHITYPYSIYKKTGRETSFRYGIFAKVDGTLYYFESDKVTINNTNEQTYFNNIQSYVKKALNLFNADNDIFPLKYKQEYANALTYSSENKGHLKLNYIKESYLKTLEEAHIDDNGFLYKLALLKSEIKEKEQDFFNDLSRQDFEIKNKEEYFNRYIKKRDTPFTNTLRQVFINTNVVITNSKTKYNPETNTIYINRKEQTKEAIIEEAIHAATFNYISQYGKATIDFNELKLTYKLEKNAPQEIVDLFSLYEKTFDMFIKNAKERLNPIEFENMILDLRWKQFGKNFIDNKVVYAAYDISDPYEFVASFWKKTDGAKFLQIKDTRNILQKIWEILLKIFHLSNNITLDNNEKTYKKIVSSIVENNINNNVWYSENIDIINFTASNQIKQKNSELKC